ncbi:MAG: tetratricopeptide repeat protein, partial [Calditrichae bacterium]|nr:tetratricopeptide repeat protein [Calditrichia bacterium]NIW80139.1 tetratricopeptide repeat protein [Calditrichia bacterium]
MMNNFFELSNLEQFYADNPNSIIFAFLAARYIELGLIDKAHTVAEKGVKQHPTYAFGHYVLGLSYYHTNDLTQAKNHLEQSLAFDNKNPRAWQLMGEMNEKLGMPL